MGLYEDVKKIFSELLGEDATKVLDTFENPKLYPQEFLDECKYFLAKIAGERIAEERLKPLYKKYRGLILNEKKRGIKFPEKKLERIKKHFSISKSSILTLDFLAISLSFKLNRQGEKEFASFPYFAFNPNFSS